FGRSACHPGATALQLSQLGIDWDQTNSGTLSSNDISERCQTEGATFETAVQAYRAQYNAWPAGSNVSAIAATLVQVQLLQSAPGYGRATASPVSTTWYYNSTTHAVDTSAC